MAPKAFLFFFAAFLFAIIMCSYANAEEQHPPAITQAIDNCLHAPAPAPNATNSPHAPNATSPPPPPSQISSPPVNTPGAFPPVMSPVEAPPTPIPVPSRSQLPPPSQHGCVHLCVELCRRYRKRRPCMSVCTACCAKYDCIPSGVFGTKTKCTQWDSVTLHGKVLKCPT